MSVCVYACYLRLWSRFRIICVFCFVLSLSVRVQVCKQLNSGCCINGCQLDPELNTKHIVVDCFYLFIENHLSELRKNIIGFYLFCVDVTVFFLFKIVFISFSYFFTYHLNLNWFMSILPFRWSLPLALLKTSLVFFFDNKYKIFR